MTNEEKSILLKDLCARLPYKPIVHARWSYRETDGTIKYKEADRELEINDFYAIGDVKPYLRPMESMTEEEKKEFTKVLVKSQDCSYENNESSTTIVNDWYLSKGFDVRGLISIGLALEAPEDMCK